PPPLIPLSAATPTQPLKVPCPPGRTPGTRGHRKSRREKPAGTRLPGAAVTHVPPQPSLASRHGQPARVLARVPDGQRALVTGAAGFIGSRLVEALLEMGLEVVGLDNFSNYYHPGLKQANIAASQDNPRFRLVTGDLAKVSLDRLLDGVDMVFHLAG